jgi:hypothetical protein
MKDICFQIKRAQSSAWCKGQKQTEKHSLCNCRILMTKLIQTSTQGKKNLCTCTHMYTYGYKNILRKGCGQFFSYIHITHSQVTSLLLLTQLRDFILIPN